MQNLFEQMCIYQDTVANLVQQFKKKGGGGSSSSIKKEVKKEEKKVETKTSTGLKKSVPAEFDVDWFYLAGDDYQQKGPISFSDLKSMYQSKKCNGETHVFGGDMSDWAEIKSVKGLLDCLKQ